MPPLRFKNFFTDSSSGLLAAANRGCAVDYTNSTEFLIVSSLISDYDAVGSDLAMPHQF
jgi:hypothetical protein